MKVEEIAGIIEKDFPIKYAFDGDNVGLLVGNPKDEVRKILITCDVDSEVVREAVTVGANLIVSHHPLMFHKVNRMTEDDPEQEAIRLMIKNNISLYSAHTNLDAANGGLNDYMASLLNIKNTDVVDVVAEDNGKNHGFGRVGMLKEPVSLERLMNNIIDVFKADGLRYEGNKNALVHKIAVNTGGGADILYRCIDLCCDVLVTGDIKYNGFRDAAQHKMAVVDIMHFDSEKIVKDFYENYFSGKLNGIPLVKSKANVNVVKTYTV